MRDSRRNIQERLEADLDIGATPRTRQKQTKKYVLQAATNKELQKKETGYLCDYFPCLFKVCTPSDVTAREKVFD
jgi:hypothetical protein